MRQAFVSVVFLCLLVGCGKSETPPAAKAEGAAAKAAASAASAPRLLLSAEDLRAVQPSLLAGGPVITGLLQPGRKADLRSELSAVVLQVYKENGEPVRTGELLVRLDETAIRDTLASAEEAARVANQALEQTERQVQRLKTLQQQGMMSTQALEDAEIRRNSAQSDLVAARSRAVSARQQLQRTTVRAPFDGVVSERKASAGDTALIGKELLKVIDPRSMRFEGLVSADRMHELKIGQAVNFRVNGYPDKEFLGRVKRLDAAANTTTRQVEVVVSFTDPAAAPRVAGLFAEGRIESGSSQALLLPESSIVRVGDSASVWRFNGAQVNKVSVKLGPRDARRGDSPVLSGLAAGERVLTHPGSNLVDGQSAELVAAASPGAKAATSATSATSATAPAAALPPKQ